MRRLPLLRSMLAVSCVSLLLVASTTWSQPQTSIGRVSALVGEATVLRQERFTPEPLTLQKPLFREDIIETGTASKVRITLTDATVISLGERSRLELRQFTHDAPQQPRMTRLAITVGIFRAIINKLIPSSTFEVITPTAIAAIRGTDLMGEVTPNSTAIVVLDGSVTIANVRPLFRGLASLTQGTGTTVTDDQPPTAPTQWSTARIDALRQALEIR